MTPLDPKTREQLCAWMDGELPADEARFLERRLADDMELRGQWERWQLASACIKGQAFSPMHSELAQRIQSAISSPDTSAHAARRSPVWGWAVAASIAALAITIGVQMRPGQTGAAPIPVAHVGESLAVPVAASPASADLVALNPASSTPAVATAEFESPEDTSSGISPRAASHVRPSIPERTSDVATLQSPMPLSAQSPTEFPLLTASQAKTWPRSPLSSTGNDVSMEAYLVRHNEMVSDGGLGGFVPYVDVVTRERDGASDNEDGDAAASGDGPQ
jgi:negative regulator of sigma E activity